MRRGMPVTIVLAAAVLAVAPTAGADPMAAAGGHDIGELMALADEHYDLDRTDAVFLLDSRHVALREDGTRETTVHRIVWISTELVTDTYADLRVPHDTADSTLDVLTLRTWHDGRWWPHESDVSPTAVVETTPSALVRADDYTSIRETMLLHDGVEIPCVLETIYTITESRAHDTGSYGLWIVPRRHPSVRVELSLTVPKGRAPSYHAGNGAPDPELDVTDPGSDTYRWSAEIVDRLERPLVSDPASYAPHVEWSTWESEGSLRAALDASLEGAFVLGDALSDTVARLVEHEPVPLLKARAVVDFVNESTRSIYYDDTFWELSPRTATRTWETAYGHRLDRAVLAAALFREVGLDASFVYRSTGHADEATPRVPGLSRYDGIAVWVQETGLSGYYDPAAGSLDVGETDLAGRALWFVAHPSRGEPGDGHRHRVLPSTYEIVLALEPDDEGGFAGDGFVSITGGMAPYDQMVGLDDESESYLLRIARSGFEDATITRHNVLRIERESVVAGFGFDVDVPEPDAEDRIELAAGDPPGGILDHLPGDVHLYGQRRASPVALAGPMTQEVTLRIKPGDREVVALPEPVSIENSVGRFSLTVVEEGEWVTVTRRLSIEAGLLGDAPGEGRSGTVAADRWPELRELLLEETDRRNRSVFLR